MTAFCLKIFLEASVELNFFLLKSTKCIFLGLFLLSVAAMLVGIVIVLF